MYLNKREIIIVAVLAVLLLLGAFFRKGGIFDSGEELTKPHAQESDGTGEEREDEEKMKKIYVDVAGAVENPGVIRLPTAARVYQALDKVVLQNDADLENINRARPLVDGEKIYVPRQGDKMDSMEEGNVIEQGKTNINRASLPQLMKLSGIGEVRAQSIITYREEHGPFQELGQIKEVSGIGPSIYESIKDDISIY